MRSALRWRPARKRKRRGQGPRLLNFEKGRPKWPPFQPRGNSRLDRKHRDDSVTAVDHDDLIVDDEVHVPAPFRINLDQGRGHRDDAYAGRHRGPDADVEVDVGRARTLGHHGVADRRFLLCGQRLRTLRLTLRSLPALTLLIVLTLR